MNKMVRTEEVLRVYNVLSAAKYQKMDDEDKVKVWKIVRKLKPVATKYDEDSKDAAEKMKPSEDFTERLEKAREYERQRQANETATAMTEQEYRDFITEFRKYNELVSKAVKEFADKEVEIEFDNLSEDAFGKLMSSNDWNMEQVSLVGDFVCE